MKCGPVVIVTGPPGAGKTTLCAALAPHFDKTLHIPVDDLRTWVVQGLSESVNWTDETERQFQLAEASACATARVYSNAGFAVLIDHCRNLPRLDQMADEHLSGVPVLRLCLLPSLESALARNKVRTNKNFDPVVLEPIIEHVTANYGEEANRPGWVFLDNSTMTVEQEAEMVLGHISGLGDPAQ